jgi:curved DNA-binding protein
MRLRGRGMPNPRGTPGDLYAEVKIVVPPQPTAEQQALWRKLAEVSAFDARGHRAGGTGGGRQ